MTTIRLTPKQTTVRETEAMSDEERNKLRTALFMCAAHCQGGHSNAGDAAAEALGVPFPIRMRDLRAQALKEGMSPDDLWPWWRERNEP